MTLRFGGTLACFADAFTPGLRSFISGAVSAVAMEELNAVHSLLFRERLREEWSPGMKEKVCFFFRSLLLAYVASAKKHMSPAVLILEDPAKAGSAAGIFTEIYSSLEIRQVNRIRLLVLGVNNLTEKFSDCWNGFFPKVIKIAFGEPYSSGIPLPVLREDLRELSYNISLLRRYYPAYLIPQLFEEEGLNRELYFRFTGIFSAQDAAVPENFYQGISDAQVLGKRAEKVRSAVRNRILFWVHSAKLHPCFDFIRILTELGGKAEDALVLKSIRADVLNGTWKGIEKAIREDCFDSLVGAENAPILLYIYKTLKALVWGENREIQEVFSEQVPEMNSEEKGFYAGCRALALTNLIAFHIGGRNIDAASEAARKALLINRDLRKDTVPAYRLFALVNVSRQRINDALEYISYALEQAEKTGQYDELLLSRYYASSINFLYGNLSKAENHAVKSEETAFELGQTKWEKRARFLRGRIYFETGRYEDALDIFESLNSERNEFGRNAAEMVNTVKAWVFRTKNYMGRFEPWQKLAGLDAGIFQIEAAYYAADYQRTAALAEDFLSDNGERMKDIFHFTEQPDWRSGFSQCEFMLQGEKDMGRKQAWVYRALALTALDPSKRAQAEISREMQRFMREELSPDTDPGDAFYFHAWYCMLKDIKASQFDMSAVVSVAFKRLQHRAGRIDNREIKQNFLNLPRWNKTLYLAAKEYKLIN
jgi:tetratricopeptide (TPR) repeat protein